MEELDLLDRKIMYELDLNARISASRLAKKLRKSKETVNFRINRLLRERYLKGFYTIFNTSLLGRMYYKIYLKFKDTTPEKEAEILDYFASQPHVAYLAHTEGDYDCVVLAMVKSPEGMADFVHPFMKKYGDFVQRKDMVVFLSTHRLNQKFLYAGAERTDYSYPVRLGNYKPDGLEQKITRLIANDARMPLSTIAKGAGVDPKAVKYRLKKLEKDKVILGYVTAPNFDKLGLRFIQINISLKDPSIRKNVVSYFDSTNKCMFAIEVLGKYDLVIEIHVQNEELKEIIDGFRTNFVNKYSEYDILAIDEERVVIWAPL